MSSLARLSHLTKPQLKSNQPARSRSLSLNVKLTDVVLLVHAPPIVKKKGSYAVCQYVNELFSFKNPPRKTLKFPRKAGANIRGFFSFHKHLTKKNHLKNSQCFTGLIFNQLQTDSRKKKQDPLWFTSSDPNLGWPTSGRKTQGFQEKKFQTRPKRMTKSR